MTLTSLPNIFILVCKNINVTNELLIDYAILNYSAFANVTWSNGDLRLVGNDSTAMAGRLEMFTVTTYSVASGEDPEGEWGTVCGDKFSMREANVACRQLGYQGASNWTFAINTE